MITWFIDGSHISLFRELSRRLLDVRIVNHIVSIDIAGQQQEKLRIFPMLKEELLDVLKNLGYQLSSLKISEDPRAVNRSGVPIRKDDSLAEVLSAIDLNQQIPSELY